MKLEIDISDRNQLAKAKAELTRLLNIVEAALLASGPNRHHPGEGVFTFATNGGHDARSGQPIVNVIDRLPRKFTTTDVILGMGTEGKENRTAIKLALKKAIDAGNLRLLQKGQGRRPSQFEKITP